jgi:hypothetical protein
MNRRTFIHTLMLTTGAISASGAQFWKQPRALGMGFKHQPKIKLALDLSEAETELARVFTTSSRCLYLFGGPVLARAEKQKTAWVNFLINGSDFPGLKKRLFDFGVEPISTPEMPGTFIKFRYNETIYNVMNCGIEEFCQLNRLNARVQLVPFAHNFLIYDCKRNELTDPFGSLAGRGENQPPQIKMVARPRTVVEGFDCVLSGRFETALLGFQPSPELRDFDSFILNGSCPPEDVPRIVERAVNYLPDAIETLGEERTAELALSPLVKEALQSGLKVEIENVWAKVKQHDAEDQPAEFMALLKEGMGCERSDAGFQDDLALYLARNGYALRRSDLAMQVAMDA